MEDEAKTLIASASAAIAFSYIFKDFPIPSFEKFLFGLLFGAIVYTFLIGLKGGDEAKALITSASAVVTFYLIFMNVPVPFFIVEIPRFGKFLLSLLFGAIAYTILIEFFKAISSD